MANEHLKITVDKEGLDKILNEYSENMAVKAIKIVNKYTNIIANESKEIIDDYMYRDTGRLITSIKPSMKIYTDRIVGEVNAGTKYAEAIHEGAKHPTKDSKETERFFVPFNKAPSLFKWAVRNKVIEVIDGVYRLVSTGQVVEPDKGGLLVHIAPTKYFEKPFNKFKNKFVEEISNILNE